MEDMICRYRRITSGAALLGAILLICSQAHATVFSVRKDGAVLCNGQPIFPAGFYHVSWQGRHKAPEQHDDLKAVAATGATLFHPSINRQKADETMLDIAASNGVYVIGSVNPKIRAEIAGKFSSHPAILGWNIGDDVSKLKSGEPIRTEHEKIKRASPDKLTYVSAYNSGEDWFPGLGAEAWMEAGAEIIGMQSYPIPWEAEVGRFGAFDYAPGHHSTCNYRARPFYAIKRTVEKARGFGHKAVFSNTQCFKWKRKGAHWRKPTPAELRNMTYQAVVAGANGILFYTFYDSGNYLPDAPELLEEGKRLIGELKQIEPYLVSGTWELQIPGENEQDRVFYSTWTCNGKTLFIAVNTDTQNRPLSHPTSGSVIRQLPGNGAGNATIRNGRLWADIPVEGVLVCEISP